jgi:hypothetical protein
MLIISIDDPKRPVSSGSKGSFISIFRTHKPRKPERKNTINAFNFFLSVNISENEIKINSNGVIFWTKGNILGIIIREGKIRIRRTNIAAMLP